MKHSVAQNTFLMTLSSIFQKILAFAYFTVIARSIDVSDTGKYFLALSFTTIFVVFVDLGLTNVLVREASRIKENISTYLSTILSVKLVLGIFSYVTLFFVSRTFYSDTQLQHMILLSGVTMLFDSFHTTVYGVLRALGDLRYEARSIVASQFLSLALGSVFLYLHFPLIFLIVAFTVPSAFNALYAGMVIYKKYGVKPVPHFNQKIFFTLSKIAIPFALAAIFARVYSYIDSILLGKMLGEEAVGFYSTPYKITFAFQFIPLALTAAIYPRMSEFYLSNKEKVTALTVDSIKYLLVCSVPIAFGIAVLARPIIVLLYTEKFSASILPLQILILGLIFSFVSFPLGAALNATNRQSTQTKIVAFVLITNIALNLLLIPKLGVSGASLSALVGNFLLASLGYFFLSKEIPFSHSEVFGVCLKILFSGFVMGVVVFFLTKEMPVLLSIPIGAVLYLFLLSQTKVFSFSEARTLIQFLKK